MPCKQNVSSPTRRSSQHGFLLNFGSSPRRRIVCSDGYAELTLSFIQSVVEAFGEAGLERLLELEPVSRLKPMVCNEGQESIEQRLQILAEIRTDEGYMAEVQPQADGSFLLKITVPFVRLRLPNLDTLQ